MALSYIDPNTRDIPFLVFQSQAHGAVTVGTTATAIPAAPLANRKILILRNQSGSVIFLGGASVTTANGFPFQPGDVLFLNCASSMPIYGIVSSGSAQVRYWELG